LDKVSLQHTAMSLHARGLDRQSLWGRAQLLDIFPGDVSKTGHPFPNVRVPTAIKAPLARIARGAMGHGVSPKSSQAHPWPQTLVGNTSGTIGPSSSTCAATCRSILCRMDNSRSQEGILSLLPFPSQSSLLLARQFATFRNSNPYLKSCRPCLPGLGSTPTITTNVLPQLLQANTRFYIKDQRSNHLHPFLIPFSCPFEILWILSSGRRR
jgi:hypothetical protein